MKNTIYTGLVALVVGMGGCSDKFNDPDAKARVADIDAIGGISGSIYHSYDRNGDGTIDEITKDYFVAAGAAGSPVHFQRRTLTEDDGTYFDNARSILDQKLKENARRKQLAEKIYGENGIADSSGDGIVSYREYVTMHLNAGLEENIVASGQYVPRTTERLLKAHTSWGNIENMQKIVDSYMKQD